MPIWTSCRKITSVPNHSLLSRAYFSKNALWTGLRTDRRTDKASCREMHLKTVWNHCFLLLVSMKTGMYCSHNRNILSLNSIQGRLLLFVISSLSDANPVITGNIHFRLPIVSLSVPTPLPRNVHFKFHIYSRVLRDSIGHYVGRSIGRSVDWSVGRSVGPKSVCFFAFFLGFWTFWIKLGFLKLKIWCIFKKTFKTL